MVAKILKFKSKADRERERIPAITETIGTEDSPALDPAQIAKGIKASFTPAELDQIKLELEAEYPEDDFYQALRKELELAEGDH